MVRNLRTSMLFQKMVCPVLTIVNGLVRRTLLRTSCLGQIFREESGARYFEEI